MNSTDQYQKLGEWLQKRFEIDFIVCQAFGKRWAFKWSNTTDIENARRIELTASTGLIVPATVSDEQAQKIKDEGLDFWRNM